MIIMHDKCFVERTNKTGRPVQDRNDVLLSTNNKSFYSNRDERSLFLPIMCYKYDKSISIRSIIYHNYLLVLLFPHTFRFSLISAYQWDLIVIYSVSLSFLHNVRAYSCSTFVFHHCAFDFFFLYYFLRYIQKMIGKSIVKLLTYKSYKK